MNHTSFSVMIVHVFRSHYAEGHDRIHVRDLRCVGNERTLADCGYTDTGVTDVCTHADDVAVVCNVPEACPREVSKHIHYMPRLSAKFSLVKSQVRTVCILYLGQITRSF